MTDAPEQPKGGELMGVKLRVDCPGSPTPLSPRTHQLGDLEWGCPICDAYNQGHKDALDTESQEVERLTAIYGEESAKDNISTVLNHVDDLKSACRDWREKRDALLVERDALRGIEKAARRIKSGFALQELYLALDIYDADTPPEGHIAHLNQKLALNDANKGQEHERGERFDGERDCVLISRFRTQRRGGRFAWYWAYRVTVPGEAHPFVGDRLDWARDLAKRKGEGGQIIEVWRVPEVEVEAPEPPIPEEPGAQGALNPFDDRCIQCQQRKLALCPHLPWKSSATPPPPNDEASGEPTIKTLPRDVIDLIRGTRTPDALAAQIYDAGRADQPPLNRGELERLADAALAIHGPTKHPFKSRDQLEVELWALLKPFYEARQGVGSSNPSTPGKGDGRDTDV